MQIDGLKVFPHISQNIQRIFFWQFQIESVAINIDSLLLYSSVAITKSFFKFVSNRKSFLMPDLVKIFEKKGSCQNQKLMYLHRKKKIEL